VLLKWKGSIYASLYLSQCYLYGLETPEKAETLLEDLAKKNNHCAIVLVEMFDSSLGAASKKVFKEVRKLARSGEPFAYTVMARAYGI
jgi:hypothetical protein